MYPYNSQFSPELDVVDHFGETIHRHLALILLIIVIIIIITLCEQLLL